MDLTEIRKLVRLMEKAELTEIEIDDSKKGVRVHLKRELAQPAALGAMAPMMPWMPSVAGGVPAMVPGVGAEAEDADPLAVPPGVEVVTSPMVGTFYRAASPDADVFSSVGAQVDEDSVLCIVEAMKVMNEIKSELRGEVVAILVENAEPVEFGQPLFHIKTS